MIVFLASHRSSFRVMKSIQQYSVAILNMNDNYATASAACVILEPGKARLFQGGNPIIYGGAVKQVLGDPVAGTEVIVKDHKGNAFGRGFFNPYSQYRVRVTVMKEDRSFNETLAILLKRRLSQAVALRRSMVLPRPDTSVYRLVNGEGDRLGGLIIDVLGDTVVTQSSALWVEIHRQLITSTLTELFGVEGKALLWRRSEARLKQDGYDDYLQYLKQQGGGGSSSSAETDMGESNAASTSMDESNASQEVTENGIRYSLCAASDQKTGFYCDQRDNRLLVRGLSKGKTVLDTYCYSGGFSLNAIKGGAKSVLAIDSSARALETLEKNINLNELHQSDRTDHLGNGRITLQQGDAVAVMEKLVQAGAQFDVVICDPPKLAPTRSSLDKAVNKYQRINSLAMSLVNRTSGGLMLTCTCSAAMTQSDRFVEVLMAAARSAGRDISIVSSSGAAADHPVLPCYLEGRYLTAVLLHVHGC